MRRHCPPSMAAKSTTHEVSGTGRPRAGLFLRRLPSRGLSRRRPKAPLHVLPQRENRPLAASKRARDACQLLGFIAGELAERPSSQDAGANLRHADALSAAGLAGAVEGIDELIP